MKIDLSKLPEKHYPGQSFMLIDKTDFSIKIAVHESGLFNFLSNSGYRNIYEVLNINPEIRYNVDLKRKTQEVVMVLSSGEMLEPKILYYWKQDHWEKIQDVRTNIS